jgi:hypothetical protein
LFGHWRAIQLFFDVKIVDVTGRGGLIPVRVVPARDSTPAPPTRPSALGNSLCGQRAVACGATNAWPPTAPPLLLSC